MVGSILPARNDVPGFRWQATRLLCMDKIDPRTINTIVRDELLVTGDKGGTRSGYGPRSVYQLAQ